MSWLGPALFPARLARGCSNFSATVLVPAPELALIAVRWGTSDSVATGAAKGGGKTATQRQRLTPHASAPACLRGYEEGAAASLAAAFASPPRKASLLLPQRNVLPLPALSFLLERANV